MNANNESRTGRVLLWIWALFAVATAGVILAIAYLNPLSEEYTRNHQLSFVCLSAASTIAFLVALFSTKKALVHSILMLAIELFLGGMIFQLLTLIT
jgi:ABC-type Fe3+-siderophore transport system permease subunit